MSNLNNILNSTARDIKAAKMLISYGASDRCIYKRVGARRGKALIKALQANRPTVGVSLNTMRTMSANMVHSMDAANYAIWKAANNLQNILH
jgi:hypothetical protein